jgi:hypothetical protein
MELSMVGDNISFEQPDPDALIFLLKFENKHFEVNTHCASVRQRGEVSVMGGAGIRPS